MVWHAFIVFFLLLGLFLHSEDRRKFIDGFTDFEYGHLPAVSWDQILPATTDALVRNWDIGSIVHKSWCLYQ